jgi:hypothetical protein
MGKVADSALKNTNPKRKPGHHNVLPRWRFGLVLPNRETCIPQK